VWQLHFLDTLLHFYKSQSDVIISIGGERGVLTKAGRRWYNAISSKLHTIIASNNFLSQALSVRTVLFVDLGHSFCL
jgi:hypothetical protein